MVSDKEEFSHQLSTSMNSSPVCPTLGTLLATILSGPLGYADDIVLLTPSPSALRLLLLECELFARE